jgi:hypothetical protein
VLVVLVCALAASAAAAARGPADVSGTWAMAVKGNGAHGDMSASLTMKQDGKEVTGTMTAHGIEHEVSGEFADGTLTLTAASGSQDQQITLTAKLQEDGRLSGYASGPMGDLRWTAERVKKQ